VRVDAFDFELPEDRIALHPVSPRDSARMLVVRPGRTQPLADHIVRELPDLLAPGDVLVLNDTRVIPAALEGFRRRGEQVARVTFNLHKRVADERWRAFARPAKRLDVGDVVRFGDEARVCLATELTATVTSKGDAGEVELAFNLSGPFLDSAIAAVGGVPLPPYIASKREASPTDAANYQTVYARHDGAVAAPTAGLHFTDELFDRLTARGVSRCFVTLHVGAGTFLPVKAENVEDHRMHAEWGEVTAETAAALNEARARGGRIVAVGTTAMRLIESAADTERRIKPFAGETEIFITPGYRFRAVDVLMTNFHLPKSTLFMLVSAFSGLETMRAAYAHAIATGYRFYSFGDSSLLFPEDR